jgi:cardiolipin synthase A/B
LEALWTSILSGGWIGTAILIVDLLIRIVLSYRIIMRRLPVGISLAWLAIILIFPLVGAVIYAFFGTRRVGKRREERLARLRDPFVRWLNQQRARFEVARMTLNPECEPISRLAEAESGFPSLPGNDLDLFDSADIVFRSLVADINAAQKSCLLEFYIWTEGGIADQVVEALIRAAGRKVVCRVLVDAHGSRDFLRGKLAQRLRSSGVGVIGALPVSLWSMFSARADIRLHRKIVVIDGEIGYTGSQNLADPRFFKQDAGVGEWIDAMVRLRGPAVEPLALTFVADWQVQTGENIEELVRTSAIHTVGEQGKSTVQVVPSGPALRGEAIDTVLLMAIYAARKELVMTTPYFVPDESLLAALISTAKRGVAVTIVVPERIDNVLVRFASRAYEADLLAAGAHVVAFRDGLLHTKSITVDDAFSLFGSLNLDQRSLRLNFEISLLIYDRDFTARLRHLQDQYISRSSPLSLGTLNGRPIPLRLAENTARLFGPLL